MGSVDRFPFAMLVNLRHESLPFSRRPEIASICLSRWQSDLLRRVRLFAGEDVCQEARIVELIEVGFDGARVEGVALEAPQDLIPSFGRTIE